MRTIIGLLTNCGKLEEKAAHPLNFIAPEAKREQLQLIKMQGVVAVMSSPTYHLEKNGILLTNAPDGWRIQSIL
jgi:hypothetical protein